MIMIIIVDFSSDGLHSPSCGLSLWQYQDGQVPLTATGQRKQQDQGKSKIAFALFSCFIFQTFNFVSDVLAWIPIQE